MPGYIKFFNKADPSRSLDVAKEFSKPVFEFLDCEYDKVKKILDDDKFISLYTDYLVKNPIEYINLTEDTTTSINLESDENQNQQEQEKSSTKNKAEQTHQIPHELITSFKYKKAYLNAFIENCFDNSTQKEIKKHTQNIDKIIKKKENVEKMLNAYEGLKIALHRTVEMRKKIILQDNYKNNFIMTRESEEYKPKCTIV